MIHADLEEGLVILPVERRDDVFTVLSTSACVGLGLIVSGILFIGYLFGKKIWI